MSARLGIICTLGSLVAAGWLAIASPALAGVTFVVNRTGDSSDLNPGDGKCDTSTASGKQCSLRAAIQEANSTTIADTINFNITSASKVISPASPLPAVTQQVTIDGYTQSGASPNTKTTGNDAVIKIVLDGVNAGAAANGLELNAYKAVVQGLDIQRFSGSGVVLSGYGDQLYGSYIGTNAAGSTARANGVGVTVTGSSDTVGNAALTKRNIISGNVGDGVRIADSATSTFVGNNYIGTDKNGTVALANGANGVYNAAPSTFVGGTGAGNGNVISGNHLSGISIERDSTVNTTKIQSNLIGLNAAGTSALGNHQGIRIAASNVTVGGSTEARNVISGNAFIGVLVYHLRTGNVIRGNYVGTDASGTADIGNGSEGILTQDSSTTIIGGSQPGDGNVVSGNGSAGISVVGGDQNQVLGNRVGSKADGTGDLGNDADGIRLIGTTNAIVGGAGSSGNAVVLNGGNGIDAAATATTATVTGNAVQKNDGAGIHVNNGAKLTITANLIQANGGEGVAVEAGSSGNLITGNQFGANGRLAIDLKGGTENSMGLTANDASDADSGANDLQNFPTLGSAKWSITTHLTTVKGSLSSLPSTQFTIHLYRAVVDPSGFGEGQILLTTKTVTTDSLGSVDFTITLSSGVAPGQTLTATATGTASSCTSEFGLNVMVVAVA